MPRIMLVADQVEAFEELARSLRNMEGVEILWSHDSEKALHKAASDAPDLVIVDEVVGEVQGLDWIQRLISVNAFVQTAAVSRLTQGDFHDTSEGLGVMAQLPPHPGKTDALRMLEMISKSPEFG